MPEFELEGRPRPSTIEEGLEEAELIVKAAHAQEGPITRTFLMLSGGNDSMVLLDVCHRLADDIVHINTTIGVPETNEFVRWVVGALDRDLVELRPPRDYRSLVLDPKLWGGFPGPAGHHFAYTRLKERCIRQLIRDHRTRRGERFALLTGIRNAESKRRMGYGAAVDRRGGQVWVNPLLRWSNELMREYRESRGLPVNEVTKHLHMSGECLCGAFAKPGEIHEIELFYPHVAEMIHALEAEARAAGLRACVWGERPPRKGAAPAGPLCASCVDWAEE